MSEFPSVTCIIVSWNVVASLKRCLDSLSNTGYPGLQIIVIDNNSDDNPDRVIKDKKNIRFIKNAENVGFPKAVNQGLAISSGDYIVLLNPDTCVPKDFFEQCLDFFSQHQTAGIMGPKLIDPDGTPQGSVFPEPSVINTIKEFWLGHRGLTDKFIPDENKPTIVNAVSGACMFMPRSTVEKIGNFTESVFMYFEDLDFCRRIRNSGLRVYFNPQIQVIHEHGSSSKQTSRAFKYLTRSSIWYNGPLKHYLMWFISWTGQAIKARPLRPDL